MSTKSGLIDTSKSMIIVDEPAFPLNLGKVVGEDNPEQSFSVLAYNGKNILPTALGYRSYFSESTLINLANIPDPLVQQLLSYQTPTLDTMLLALCETGLYIACATEGVTTGWSLVYANPNVVTNIKHSWSFAVVGNKLCLYVQGAPKFLVIADSASILNLISQAGNHPGAVVAEVLNDSTRQFKIATVVPTFLNMAGQMGLFRADNRLGFWDSDNAVAWSSVNTLVDFTPSIKSAAGITTFSDVQGRIIKILGHGDDFVIYATRSITLARGNIASPERWAGTAILSNAGVSWDTQIAAAQPDTMHFALTSTGLVKISNGAPEFIFAEVTDYVQEQSSIVSVEVLDGRYLFLYTTDDLAASRLEVDTVKVDDGHGNAYTFLDTKNGAGTPPYQYSDFETDAQWNQFWYTSSNGSSYDRWEISADTPLKGIRSLRTTDTMSFPGFGVIWAVKAATVAAYAGLASLNIRVTAKLRVQITSLVGGPWIQIGSLPIQEFTTLGTYYFDIDVTAAYPGTNTIYVIQFDNGLIGQVGGSRLTLDNIRIYNPDLPIGWTPIQKVSFSINGASSQTQAGFTNFEESNINNALVASGQDYPIIPCYSGGRFSSDWMTFDFEYNDDVDTSDRNITLENNFFAVVNLKTVKFKTGLTTTQLGPVYDDALGSDKIRYIDKAGQELVELYQEDFTNLNQQLANQTSCFATPLATAPDYAEGTVFGLDIIPYPQYAELVDLLGSIDTSDIEHLGNQVNYTVDIEDVILPSSLTAAVTECATIFKAQGVKARFQSTCNGNLEIQTKILYQTWHYPIYDPSNEEVKAAAITLYWEVTPETYAKYTLEGADYYGDQEFLLHSLDRPDDEALVRLFDSRFMLLKYPAEVKILVHPESSLAVSVGELSAAMVWAETAVLGSMNTDIDGRSNPVYTLYQNPISIYGHYLYNSAGVESLYLDASSLSWPLAFTSGGNSYSLQSTTRSGPMSPPVADWDSYNVDATVGFSIGSIVFSGFDGHIYSPGENSGLGIYNRTTLTYLVNGGPSTITYSYPDHIYSRGIYKRDVSYTKPDGTTGTYQQMFTEPETGLPETDTAQTSIDAFIAAYTVDSVRALVALKPAHLKFKYKWQLTTGLLPEVTTPELNLLASEVSGYGFEPAPYSFRKTHSRISSTSCPMPLEYAPFNSQDEFPSGGFILPTLTGKGQVGPPNTFPYPTPVPIDPVYFLFQRGSAGPYYPVYKAAVVWDMLLNKFGRYSNPHKVLYSLLPINYSDGSIIALKDRGLLGGSVTADNKMTVFGGDHRTGVITYGRIGNYRLGVTVVNGITVRFAEPATCTLVVETSLDGVSIDPTLSLAIAVNASLQVDMPFTLTGKWFNIRLEGEFNLVAIQYLGEGRGRR